MPDELEELLPDENSVLVDKLIMRTKNLQLRIGRKLSISDLLDILAGIYDIPHDPDHPAGPVLVLAAELMLRLVNLKEGS
jgi:hypothetical protein